RRESIHWLDTRDRVRQTVRLQDSTPTTLDGPECVGWRELCGADGREESSDGADEDGSGEPADPGCRVDDGGPVFEVGVDDRGDGTGGDAGGAAEEGEEDRLGKELSSDLAFGGAEAAAEADLGAALEHPN